MYNLRQINHRFYLKFLLLFACTNIFVNFISASMASAEQAEKAQPVRRLRPSFFEEHRKLRRFGFGDFLRSALDNEQNALSDTAKVSNLSDIYDFFNSPGQIQGRLFVGNRDTDSKDFLNGTEFVGSKGTLSFSNFVRGSDPRIGTVNVTGSISTPNGQTINFNGTTVNYNAGFSSRDDNASGVVLITDPNNPSQSIYIQVPTANIAERDDSVPFDAPAGLTIGLPSDR